MTTVDEARALELLYTELRTLSTTLVRAIKDEATPDAELLLLKHLFDVRTATQAEVFAQIHAAHQEIPIWAEDDTTTANILAEEQAESVAVQDALDAENPNL